MYRYATSILASTNICVRQTRGNTEAHNRYLEALPLHKIIVSHWTNVSEGSTRKFAPEDESRVCFET